MGKHSKAQKQQATPTPTTITDAVTYVDKVAEEFKDDPAIYSTFLDVISSVSKKQTSALDAVEKISILFAKHIDLIRGLVAFLPAGYRVEFSGPNMNGVKILNASGDVKRAFDTDDKTKVVLNEDPSIHSSTSEYTPATELQSTSSPIPSSPTLLYGSPLRSERPEPFPDAETSPEAIASRAPSPIPEDASLGLSPTHSVLPTSTAPIVAMVSGPDDPTDSSGPNPPTEHSEINELRVQLEEERAKSTLLEADLSARTTREERLQNELVLLKGEKDSLESKLRSNIVALERTIDTLRAEQLGSSAIPSLLQAYLQLDKIAYSSSQKRNRLDLEDS